MEDIDGRFDVRFNFNRTQAIVIIYPPQGDGKEVHQGEIVDRLRQMRVAPNLIRDAAIFDGILQARATAMAMEVVAAQGALPVNGQDAKIHYNLPESVLRHHPPRHPDLPGATNWLAIDPRQFVKKGQEIASITPVKLGVMGKTCSLPVQDVSYAPGKPPDGAIGDNAILDAYGLHAYSAEDGYFYLHGERLTVIPLRVSYHELKDGKYAFSKGALLYEGASGAEIVGEEFVAIRKAVKNCELRVHGDTLLQNVENSTIIASGNVYVEGYLLNCDVLTPQKVICSGKSRIVGGTIRAYQGVTAGIVGAFDGVETLLEVGNDHYTPLRTAEVERELLACQYNLRRVQATLKPFEDSPMHRTLPNYREMVEKCRSLQYAELERIRQLKKARRRLAVFAKEFVSATIEARAVYPGALIRSGRLQFIVESALHDVQFVEAMRRTEIRAEPLPKAG